MRKIKPFKSFCLLVKMSNIRNWIDNYSTNISFKLSFKGIGKGLEGLELSLMSKKFKWLKVMGPYQLYRIIRHHSS